MACLYIADAAVGDLRLLKLGITHDHEPWGRLHTHRTSKDNPFRQRIAPAVASAFVFGSIWEARHVERLIKLHAVRWLPRFTSDVFWKKSLMLAPGLKPSGEWIVHTLDQRDGISHLYSMIESAVADEVDPAATTVFCNASADWDHGGGFRSYDVSLARRCA